jgi:UDP-N-acetyl-D-mannosaminuronate dehydrogenase
MEPGPRIVVIGLGYVGLPLAVALARKFETIGFDIDQGASTSCVAARIGLTKSINRRCEIPRSS